MSKIGIVYAAGSKMIRRVIVPDDPAQLDQVGWYNPATEDMLITDAATKESNDPANQSHVNRAMVEQLSATPPVIVCAVVDDRSMVEAMILADPAIDRLPMKTLIEAYSPEITHGCVYESATGLFWKPAYTIPGYYDRLTGEWVDPVDVPAAPIEMPPPSPMPAEAVK